MANEMGIRARAVDNGVGLPVTTKDVLPRGPLGARSRTLLKPSGVKRPWLSFFNVLRRPAVLCLAAILVIAGRSLYSGSAMVDLPTRRAHSQPPGSVYRSHLAYARFAANMSAADDIPVEGALEWQALKSDTGWRPCAGRKRVVPESRYTSNGYISPVVNGGLNQQRSAICNAVAIAKLLNATLVIPHLYYHAIWKDPSTFEDIFDVNHFIMALFADIEIVHQLPKEYQFLTEDYRQKTKVPAWSSPSYYLTEVLPLLRAKGALRLDPFANRLTYDDVEPALQQLRCRANFHALRFAPRIKSMADTIVERMVARSPGGRYLAVHLRFEKDMVAFSNCLYDGGTQEREEMAAFREVGWSGKFTRPGRKAIDPGSVRRAGKCPLTPLEVGLILRGMGFPASTPVYLAAGDVYGGLPPALRDMFPSLQTKETLLSPDELAPFKGRSSQLAALDFTVCVAAEVFMATQGGNFPQLVEGHRRYRNQNHWKTVSPDKKALARLLDNHTLQWADFSAELRAMREDNDLHGVAERKREQSLYSYPAPECMCREGQPGYQDAPEDEEEEEDPGWIKNRGRNLGLGDGEAEAETRRREADGWEERGAREKKELEVGRGEKQGTRSRKEEEAEVWGALRGEWADEGTTPTRRAKEGDEEDETEETEEVENDNPDTDRLKRSRKAEKRAASEGADNWGLMDDRPRVGRRLPVDEQR